MKKQLVQVVYDLSASSLPPEIPAPQLSLSKGNPIRFKFKRVNSVQNVILSEKKSRAFTCLEFRTTL